MASSYIVPEKEEGVEVFKDGVTEQDEKNDLQSIEDLPKFLRRGILFTPIKYKKMHILLSILSQMGISLPTMTYITSSVVIGVTIAVYFSITACTMLLQPDFTKGVFLDLLLKDAKLTKKMNDNPTTNYYRIIDRYLDNTSMYII